MMGWNVLFPDLLETHGISAPTRIENIEIDSKDLNQKTLRNSRSISSNAVYLGRNYSPRLLPRETRA